MADGTQQADDASAEGTPRPANQGLPWVLLVLGLVGASALYFVAYTPVAKERDQLSSELAAYKRAAASSSARFIETEQQLAISRAAVKELQTTLTAEEEKRKAAQDALKRLQLDLGAALSAEVESGEVLVQTRDGRVTVDVSDKLLFDTGQVEVSESGKKVLKHVAQTLKRLPKLVFQVAGHTDSAKVRTPQLREKYPTNWELSTARATNVVRYLQERGGVPGNRLVAAGHAQYRPTASNRTEATRAKNRRIEITLFQPPSFKAPE